MVGVIFFSVFLEQGVRRRSVVPCQKQGCNEEGLSEGDAGGKMKAKAFVLQRELEQREQCYF